MPYKLYALRPISGMLVANRSLPKRFETGTGVFDHANGMPFGRGADRLSIWVKNLDIIKARSIEWGREQIDILFWPKIEYHLNMGGVGSRYGWYGTPGTPSGLRKGEYGYFFGKITRYQL